MQEYKEPEFEHFEAVTVLHPSLFSALHIAHAPLLQNVVGLEQSPSPVQVEIHVFVFVSQTESADKCSQSSSPEHPVHVKIEPEFEHLGAVAREHPLLSLI